MSAESDQSNQPQPEIVSKVAHRWVARMPWLDSVAGVMQKTFEPILGQDKPPLLRDLLYGTPLGHPLHPAVVQLPIGFWTSSMVLDAVGEERAADLTLGLGVLSALGAAATGAAQWQDATNDEQPRRMGAFHAALNVAATTVYGASWLQRRGGHRGSGIALAVVGGSIATVAAWLGGELAYDLGLGVKRTAFEEPPADWVSVLSSPELEEGKPRRVDAAGVPVMLIRQGGDIRAISAVCTHLGGPLDEGKIEGDTVTCPWHGSVFCLRDGRVLHGPATAPETAYEARVRGGRVQVRRRPIVAAAG